MDYRTPWSVSVEEGGAFYAATYRVWDTTKRWIFLCQHGKREPIDHAIHCVNAHDALVAALQSCLAAMEAWGAEEDGVPEWSHNPDMSPWAAYDAGKVALAKAQEATP